MAAESRALALLITEKSSERLNSMGEILAFDMIITNASLKQLLIKDFKKGQKNLFLKQMSQIQHRSSSRG